MFNTLREMSYWYILILIMFSTTISFTDSCASFPSFKKSKITQEFELTTTNHPPTTFETTTTELEESITTMSKNSFKGMVQCPEQHAGHSLCVHGSCYLLLGEIVCHCEEGYSGVHCHDKLPDGNYHSQITIRKDSDSTIDNEEQQLLVTTPKRPYTTLLKSECEPEMSENFCFNNGKCFKYELIKSKRKKKTQEGPYLECECNEGYEGKRCNEKTLKGRYRRRRGIHGMIKSSDHASRATGGDRQLSLINEKRANNRFFKKFD